MKIIINLALLGLAYYAIFFLAKPQWEEAKNVKQEVNSYKETLDNIHKMQELRNKLLREYNSISEDEKKKLENMFASSLNEGELMEMFSGLAEVNELIFLDIAFDKNTGANQSAAVIGGGKAANNSYAPYGINISVEGSYNALKSFLKSVEKSLVIIDVETISFNAAKTDSKTKNPDNFQYKIKGFVYLKK